MIETSPLMWVGFNIFILIALLFDLVVHNRKPHSIEFREACVWSVFWVALALGFNVLLYFTHGAQPALDFLAGYLIEKSLSVDNLFVFLIIFSYFKTPEKLLHRVLFYGILGAILMRAAFIFGGIALVQEFRWLFYVLGAFLIYVGIKITIQKESDSHPEQNPLTTWLKKWMPVTEQYYGNQFFVKLDKKWYATPLLLTLLTVEFTDLIFAIDSIPAILAITLDPFIVYTSNIFAILGLRALFFALKASLKLFHYLHYALGAILSFVGFKMLISSWIHLPTTIALGFIVVALSLAVILSLIYPKREN